MGRASGLCAQGNWTSYRAHHLAAALVALDRSFPRRGAAGLDAHFIARETLPAPVRRYGTTIKAAGLLEIARSSQPPRSRGAISTRARAFFPPPHVAATSLMGS